MRTTEKTIQSSIEAALFAIGDAVEIEKLAEAIGVGEDVITEEANRLMEKYEREGAGIRLIRLDNSFQLASNPKHYDVIQKITQAKKKQALSMAALETLSVIAYNQPVTKSAIDFIRGVDCTYSVSRLIERDLIEECGRADTPGRPILYRTTVNFLRSFNLETLDDLPDLPEPEVPEAENESADVIERAAEQEAQDGGDGA